VDQKGQTTIEALSEKEGTIHTYADGIANYPCGKSSSDSGRRSTAGRTSNVFVFRDRREIQILYAPPSPPDGERKRARAPSSSSEEVPDGCQQQESHN
jgi:hypothetical protein